MDIILTISKITNIPYRHIEAVTDMLQNGDTIPFISRYRKEATGSLDEVAIFNISKLYDNFTALEKRKKTVIDKLWGTYEEKCAQLRTLYFYMYAHPGKKLNFMGNELGHFREWDEKRELDWELLKYPFHDAFQKYFGALSRLYATQPALYAGEYDPRCFEWVASESRDEGVYAWLRKGAGQTILCVMNTQNTAHKKFPLYLSFPAGAEELLNTEAPCWGGADKSKPKVLHTSDGGVYGRDYTLTVDLPAMGSRMFKLTPEAPRPEAAQASARRAAAARRKAARTQNAKADAAAYNSKK